MRYRVHGINRATGTETAVTIDASDTKMAETVAQRTLVVAEIQPEQIPDRDESLNELATAVQNKPRLMGRLPVPSYSGIEVGAAVLRVLSVLCYGGAIIAGVLLVVSLAELFAMGVSHRGNPEVDPATCLVAFMGNLVTGAVLGMLASLGLAVRDIARNSYAR